MAPPNQTHKARRAFRQIELETHRTLTLHTSLEDNIVKCNPQDQSPLYSVLPKEIRDLIFGFATAQFEDPTQPYKETEFYYRPGYTARRRIDTNLVLACRLIWLEAGHLPMRQAEHSYWHGRGPRHPATIIDRKALTKLNVDNITAVNLHLQMANAESISTGESFLPRFMDNLRPRVLKITIRHSDWWYWEKEDPMYLKHEWVQHVLDHPLVARLQQFQLELETLERNTKQLQPIVDRLLTLEGPLLPVHSEILDSRERQKMKVTDPPNIWHWTGPYIGPVKVGHQLYDPYKGMDKLDYHVAVLTWRPVRVAVSGDDATHVPEIDSTVVSAIDSPTVPENASTAETPAQIAARNFMPPRIGRIIFRGQLGRPGPHRPVEEVWGPSWGRLFHRGQYRRNTEHLQWQPPTQPLELAQNDSSYYEAVVLSEWAKTFDTLMKNWRANVRAEEFRQKWEAEGSLLKFLE